MPIPEYKKPDDWYFDYATEILPTGSRVICDVGPNQANQKAFFENSDEDYMLLLEEGVVKPLETRLEAEGWVLGGSLNKPVTQGLTRKYVFRTTLNHWIEKGWKIKSKMSDDVYDVYLPQSKQERPPLKAYPDMETEEGLFRSWKKERINLLLTCSPDYFENFCKATSLAKRLNLLKKEDRVVLFQAVTRDVWPNQKPSKYSVGNGIFTEGMAMEEPAPLPQNWAENLINLPGIALPNQQIWSTTV